MLLNLGLLALGLAMLYYGGEALVGGASRLALKLGVSELVVGLTVVAFGTSAPELFVSLDAALAGLDDVALGNVVGSNICNIALILGLSALICPVTVNARLVRLELPLLAVASAGLLYAVFDGVVGRLEGIAGLALLVAYLVYTVMALPREAAQVREELASAAPSGAWTLGRDLLFIVGGLVVLVLGAGWFIDGAVGLATGVGISQAFIGLTVVAVGTSLPELAVTVLAARGGQGDIAVGNVVGSNIFNILAILGITSLVTPVHQGGLDWGDLLAMMGITLVLGGMMLAGSRLGRIHGALLLILYVAFLGWRATLG